MMTDNTTHILSCEFWKNCDSYKAIDDDKMTQPKYYRLNNATPQVQKLVEMTSKTFGTESERIIAEIFKLGARTSTQNDGTMNGKKIEIKCARYWEGKDDCKWQHLEEFHDFDYALFVLLDFTGWKVWCIKKSLLMGDMRTKNIVVRQGEEGHITMKSKILPYMTPIRTIAELQAFVQ